MLKIRQNWGKIANYPPNAQQRSAPPDKAIGSNSISAGSRGLLINSTQFLLVVKFVKFILLEFRKS